MTGTEITEAYDWRGLLDAEGEKLGKVRKAHPGTVILGRVGVAPVLDSDRTFAGGGGLSL
jgi:hypothetical protein